MLVAKTFQSSKVSVSNYKWKRKYFACNSLLSFVSQTPNRSPSLAFWNVRSWILRSMTLDSWVSVNALHVFLPTLCFTFFSVSLLFSLLSFRWWMLEINEKQFHNIFFARKVDTCGSDVIVWGNLQCRRSPDSCRWKASRWVMRTSPLKCLTFGMGNQKSNIEI